MGILESILKLLAGIGLFLFAMYLIEDSLKNLSGRNFKIFLQRITKNKLGAVSGGAIVTGVLQSSSMVSLMVLAFVGAGVFTMKNAMAIILGANLGTTLDSWLVATLGFKMDIEWIAYPAVCIGGLLLILFSSRKWVKYVSYFLFGFGLLFIGLAFMKTAMEHQVKQFDFSKYAEMSPFVFLCIGFIITLLVQSSSVTMALTLSAIHSGAIGFYPAAAIVLGSETGTTIKIMLGAIGGNANKKRIVVGNFIFNILLTVPVFIFLSQILLLITNIFNVKDPLIGLVTFSSLINLLGIILLLPFLDPFVNLLEKLFTDSDSSASAFIGNANINETETALDLFKRETEYFIHCSILYNLSLFEINSDSLPEPDNYKIIQERKKFYSKTIEEKYEFLKQLQGELQSFYIELRSKLESKEATQLNQFIASVRSSMHSVKSLKGITANISNLSRSSKDIKFNFFTLHQKENERLYIQLNEFMMQPETASFEKLQDTIDIIENNYSSTLNDFYKKAPEAPLEDLDITTIINFNRELFTANKAMLMAVKDFVLQENEADDFNEILKYKT